MWNYLDRIGFQLDCLLYAILGGPEDTPISLGAARARVIEQQQRRLGWGCILCRWLSWTVERHHCARQLEGRPVVRWGALLAGLQLAMVAFLLGAGFYWGLIPALFRWW